MPTIIADDYTSKVLHVGGYGNGWSEDYSVSKAIANGDKVYFGKIPAGIRVHTVKAPAGLTMSYEPVNDVPAADNFKELTPVTFNRDVKLVGTATAALANGATIVVTGQVVGAP